jgi:hypothetical protein
MVGPGVAPIRALAGARILLKADQGEGGAARADAAVAGALDVHPATVARVRRRFVEEGLEATLERKRPDRVYARALDGAQEAHLVAIACSAAPEDRRGGTCGSWPTNWCALRSSTPSPTGPCVRL